MSTQREEIDLANDLLSGAQAIADYLGWDKRRVYYAAAQGHLPIKAIGRALSARKSELIKATSCVEAA